MGKQLVTKHNALIEASYRLSLTEMQIILYGISLINPKSEEFPLIYQIEINRFASLFNRKHKQLYGEIKETVLKRFWERDFSYVNDQKETMLVRWLTRVKYCDQQGTLEIKFNEEIQSYLHQLKSNFTSYYIDQIATFKSIYSVRIYETILMNLKRNKSQEHNSYLKIEELKSRLEINNKYSRFYDLKKR